MERIIEIENNENSIKEPINSKEFPRITKGISFNNVSFSYEKGVPVLKNISCLFEKGKTTAIVGPSGSGKTTMIDLIEKFYLADSGDISFDDISIKDINSSKIRDNIYSRTRNNTC